MLKAVPELHLLAQCFPHAEVHQCFWRQQQIRSIQSGPGGETGFYMSAITMILSALVYEAPQETLFPSGTSPAAAGCSRQLKQHLQKDGGLETCSLWISTQATTTQSEAAQYNHAGLHRPLPCPHPHSYHYNWCVLFWETQRDKNKLQSTGEQEW